MQTSLKQIIEELEKLNTFFEYTEEPDAFETQSEREMNAAIEKEIDASLLQGYNYEKEKHTVKEAILHNLYQHFCSYKFLRDLHVIGDRLQFWMPANKWDWLYNWEATSNALKQADLRVYKYNSSEGYLVEVQ